MAKIYSNDSPVKANKRNPKEETVAFLLNYSKALKVSNYKNLQFESILN